MTREAQIPLFLWVAAAIVAHLIWGGGAERVAGVIEERVEIREFARAVRSYVGRGTGTLEVALLDESEPEPTVPEPPPEAPPATALDDAEKESAAEDEDEKPAKRSKTPEQELDEELEKKAEAPKTPEPAKEKEEEPKKLETPPLEVPPPDTSRRIAVQQHVKDPNQPDNPEAEFIADQANKVEQQTQAKITSTDQNDPNPTSATRATASSSNDEPGDSDINKVAQSEDREGSPDRPNDDATKPSELRIAETRAAEKTPGAAEEERRQAGESNGAVEAKVPSQAPAQAGQLPLPETKQAEGMPKTLDSSAGSFTVPGERTASLEQKGRVGRKERKLPPRKSGGLGDLFGLGAAGLSPGGVNLNLSPRVAVSAIGQDRLARERVADGERRRSQHAGRWKPGGIERWRSAIENYAPSVRPGNQTALNTARVPFASYLNQIHNRLHPVFADGFLSSLDDLPSSHPMNQMGMSTNIEIVLDEEEGRIQRMGVTKTSGVTAFDIAALESVHKAQPFGTPPRAIVSPDGNVYLHWEFHRDPNNACSTYYARPFILKLQPKSVPPEITPEEPSAPAEGERHGKAQPRRAPARGWPSESNVALANAD
jgi:hypothetical protein